MARDMREHLIDDLSGEEVGELLTRQFIGDDGNVYEIDLGKENADDYDEFRAKYQDKARLVGLMGKIHPPVPTTPAKGKSGSGAKASTRRAGTSTPAKSGDGNGSGPRLDRAESQKMREWARTHGWPDLKDRGRMPHEVPAKYREAMEA